MHAPGFRVLDCRAPSGLSGQPVETAGTDHWHGPAAMLQSVCSLRLRRELGPPMPHRPLPSRAPATPRLFQAQPASWTRKPGAAGPVRVEAPVLEGTPVLGSPR